VIGTALLNPGMSVLTLAWRPFLDPLDLHAYWYALLIPLALGISIADKAVRVRNMERYWMNVLTMTAQIVGSIIGLGLLAYIVLILIVPRLIPMEM
jgi:hypothetical protein